MQPGTKMINTISMSIATTSRPEAIPIRTNKNTYGAVEEEQDSSVTMSQNMVIDADEIVIFGELIVGDVFVHNHDDHRSTPQCTPWREMGKR